MSKRKSMINILYQNIVITILFFVVISLLVNGIISANLYQGTADNGDVVVKSIAGHIAERMEEPARDIREIQKIIAQDVLNERDTAEYLDGILEDNAFFLGIEILDKKGTVISSAPSEFDAIGMDRSGENFFKITKTNGEFYWSDLDTLIMSGTPTISVSSIYGDKVFVVYLNIVEISRISLDYSKYFGNHIEMFIMDDKGTYIANNQTSMIYERALSKDIGRIRDTVKNDSIYFKDIEGNKIVNVAFINNSRWYVSLYSSVEHAMAPIRNTYFLFYLFLGLVAFLSIIFYRKGKSLSGEIRAFSNQTKSIASGNFTIEVENQRFAELHDLSENFSTMVNELKERDLRLVEYAYVDSLTGLPNRRDMMEKLKEYIKREDVFAIIYFDLDQFKDINDSCGHYIGDIVLNVVANRIVDSIEGDGLLARIGGDEFLYLISSEYGEDHINKRVEGIIERISKPFEVDNQEMFVSISAGIAFYPRDADNFEDLLKFSDMAMYAAKNKGTNKYEYFVEGMKAEFDRKVKVERHLRSAIAMKEFRCFFQPQIELNTGSIIGFEALIRWNNNVLGNVSPEEFIKVAETRNLMGDITLWMFKNSIEGVLQLQKRFGKAFKLSVNVSVADFKRNEFPQEVMAILKETGMNPELLEIEITENMMIDNFDEIVEVLYQFKKYGIRISLDDFGTGYSSLSYLKQLPIDTLKIDREFLNASQFNDKGFHLIEAIIGMADKLNFMVIAEGIETVEQLENLKNINCYGGQGYLMCRPLPLDELVLYVEKKEKNQ